MPVEHYRGRLNDGYPDGGTHIQSIPILFSISDFWFHERQYTTT